MKNIIKYTKYTLMAALLASVFSCEKPEEGLEPQLSINANIVRFRIYQNQNIFFDGTIQEDVIRVTIPEGIDKTKIYPEILLSAGATVNPASGTLQNFTNPVEFTVTSESRTVTKTYEVIVNN
ncbi:MAG: DUF5018 domain-containing protein [Dysgonamonadaceae bacterium]|jgi:hypothetical protein|nr:DUF5018 domain-containing protein [Dysgonamonadaceae bacterium]